MNQSNQKKIKLEPELGKHLKKLRQFISQQNWENSINVCEELLIICTEKLLSIDPEKTKPEKYTILGDFLLEQGKVAGALACYNQATDLKEKLANFYKKLGLNYLEKKDFAQALNYFNKVLELNPNSAENQSNLGSVYAHLQYWEKAISHYQEALRLDPQLAAVYRNLARLYTKLNRQKEANEYRYQGFIIENKLVTAQKSYKLGHNFLTKNQLSQSLFCYRRAMELNDDYNWNYAQLKRNFDNNKQPKEAVYFFQQLGLLFFENKQYKQAVESNKIAIELSKKIGEISEQLITQYRKAVENYPDASALDYHHLGNLLRSQNNFDEAIDFMLKSIQLSPNFNQSYIWLQYTKITENQREKIINVYRQALIKEPKNEVIWGNLADLLIVNNPKEAINCYQKGAYLKAIKKNPNLGNLTWPSRKEKGPDFIIIGAPKGGTTSLYGHIDSHPQVFLPHKKELDFFSRCYSHGVESYLAQFPTITDNPEYITGEATPYYLSYTGVPSKVHSLCPEVKLIVLLRNPVEQVISYHYHKVNSGIYQLTLEQAINEELKPIDNLSEEEIMQLLIPENFGLMVCLYYYHLKRWMQYFPREQFLIIKSEDFFKNTRQYVQEVYKFLGLPEYELKEYRKVNIGYYPTISQETRQFLADYCRPHNQKLEEFLGMKFDWD